jgi:predicted HicB family RNase H-like nuclease
MDMDSPALPPADYSGALYLRCPRSLPTAIKRAALQNMTSISGYVRSAVLAQLRLDGFEIKGADNC